VVKEDAIDRIHSVTLTVIFNHPKSIKLGGSIRAAWVEWRFFVLRGLGIAKKLAGGSLVKTGTARHPPNGFQNARGAQAGDISRVFWHIE
jgi:hypothetical protein